MSCQILDLHEDRFLELQVYLANQHRQIKSIFLLFQHKILYEKVSKLAVQYSKMKRKSHLWIVHLQLQVSLLLSFIGILNAALLPIIIALYRTIRTLILTYLHSLAILLSLKRFHFSSFIIGLANFVILDEVEIFI